MILFIDVFLHSLEVHVVETNSYGFDCFSSQARVTEIHSSSIFSDSFLTLFCDFAFMIFDKHNLAFPAVGLHLGID